VASFWVFLSLRMDSYLWEERSRGIFANLPILYKKSQAAVSTDWLFIPLKGSYRAGGRGGKMAQTMYAHMNKWIKKRKENYFSIAVISMWSLIIFSSD
jgi:hypothetical protein